MGRAFFEFVLRAALLSLFRSYSRAFPIDRSNGILPHPRFSMLGIKFFSPVCTLSPTSFISSCTSSSSSSSPFLSGCGPLSHPPYHCALCLSDRRSFFFCRSLFIAGSLCFVPRSGFSSATMLVPSPVVSPRVLFSLFPCLLFPCLSFPLSLTSFSPLSFYLSLLCFPLFLYPILFYIHVLLCLSLSFCFLLSVFYSAHSLSFSVFLSPFPSMIITISI